MQTTPTENATMRYIAVQWLHASASDPVELYSELDAAGWEQRKVEVFRDGHCDYADTEAQTGSTQLGSAPVPPLSKIAVDSQFVPREITAEEFETLWSARQNR